MSKPSYRIFFTVITVMSLEVCCLWINVVLNQLCKDKETAVSPALEHNKLDQMGAWQLFGL